LLMPGSMSILGTGVMDDTEDDGVVMDSESKWFYEMQGS